LNDQHHDSDGQDLGSEPFAEEDGDPVAAFEALRGTVEELSRDLTREMTTIRKGVEAAFDQFDRQGAPVDYSADLGRIVDNLSVVGESLQAVEKLPVLRLNPNELTRAAERGGESLARSLAREVEEAKRDLVREAGILAEYTKSAREREIQARNLWIAGFGGLVMGIAAILILPHLLPYEFDTRIASAVMWADRWNAGAAMMQAGNPAGASWLADANQLARLNADALEKCRKVANDANKDQKCTITVPVAGK
jgi:hypothetical protein